MHEEQQAPCMCQPSWNNHHVHCVNLASALAIFQASSLGRLAFLSLWHPSSAFKLWHPPSSRGLQAAAHLGMTEWRLLSQAAALMMPL